MAATVAAIDEFGLIRRWFAPLATGAAGAFDLTDDAALLDLPPATRPVVTVDTIVEGVHFLADDPAESVALKLLGVNLSDLAAMAAVPVAYVLALGLPRQWPESRRDAWLDGFTTGLAEGQRRYAIHLIGGDTVAVPGPACLTVTAFGAVGEGGPVRRAGARPGDAVWVSGTIGDGVLGLRVLDGTLRGLPDDLAAAVVERYRRPQPRVALGPRLLGVASACADVSDGLAADLGHVCLASGVAAAIEASRIPLSASGRAAVAADPSLLADLLTGGDDYELVFTAAPGRSAEIVAAGAAAATPVTAIGSIEARLDTLADPVRIVDAAGRPVATRGGWRHF